MRLLASLFLLLPVIQAGWNPWWFLFPPPPPPPPPPCLPCSERERDREVPLIDRHPDLTPIVCDNLISPEAIYTGLMGIMQRAEDAMRACRADNVGVHEERMQDEVLPGADRVAPWAHLRSHPVHASLIDTLTIKGEQLIAMARGKCFLDLRLLMKLQRVAMKMIINQHSCLRIQCNLAHSPAGSGPWRSWPWRPSRSWPWHPSRSSIPNKPGWSWPGWPSRSWPWNPSRSHPPWPRRYGPGRSWPWNPSRSWPWNPSRSWPWNAWPQIARVIPPQWIPWVRSYMGSLGLSWPWSPRPRSGRSWPWNPQSRSSGGRSWPWNPQSRSSGGRSWPWNPQSRSPGGRSWPWNPQSSGTGGNGQVGRWPYNTWPWSKLPRWHFPYNRFPHNRWPYLPHYYAPREWYAGPLGPHGRPISGHSSPCADCDANRNHIYPHDRPIYRE